MDVVVMAEEVAAAVPEEGIRGWCLQRFRGTYFYIGSVNKGKDGDMLRTSMGKMTTYISTKYGNEAAQE